MSIANRDVPVAFTFSIRLEISSGGFDVYRSFRVLSILNDFVTLYRLDKD